MVKTTDALWSAEATALCQHQWRSYTGARGGHGPPSFCLGPGHTPLVFGEYIDVY